MRKRIKRHEIPEGCPVFESKNNLWYQPTDDDCFKLDLENEHYVIAWTGYKGSGKTLSMTAFICQSMLNYNAPVWTNYQVKFCWIDKNGRLWLYESEPIDFNLFYSLSHEMQEGIVAIDELPMYAESRSSMQIKNRLIDYAIMQTRKRAVSFFFTAQNIEWIDKRIRWSADIEFSCRDAIALDFKNGHRRGEKVLLDLMDHSGQLTHNPYYLTQKRYPFTLQAKDYWDAYSTRELVDPFDAMAGVELDLQKRTITDKDNGNGFDAESYMAQIKEMMTIKDTWLAADFWASLDIYNNFNKNKLRSLMSRIGIKMGSEKGEKTFLLRKENALI